MAITTAKVYIRPATAADQLSITSIVRNAKINPMGLDWRRFRVAEDTGRVIGTGQIKPHHDGSRELASIAVIPARQREGIATALIQNLMAQELGPLHLMCQQNLTTYYARFGFSRIPFQAMPTYFRRMVLLARILSPVGRLFAKDGIHIVVMKRAARDGA